MPLVGAQLGDDMGFVLILIAANYHQAIVCGEVRTEEGEGVGERGEEGEEKKGGEEGGEKRERRGETK